MVTFTANKALGMPLVGGDVGVWGQPLNNNSSVLDASLGGVATIPISSVSGAITLLASNYNNVYLVFTGTLTQNTIVTFPSVGSFYYVSNLTNASSQFTVTAASTGSVSVIGLPPGQTQAIATTAAAVAYLGLPQIGTYWDYSGSSVPNWVSACTVPPWLPCDGTIFSSATYPYLSNILGGTTLPDSKGRVRASLNQGTTRLSTISGGVDGNTLFAGGGLDTETMTIAQMPAHSHTYVNGDLILIERSTTTGGTVSVPAGGNLFLNSSATDLTGGSSAHPNVQPTYIGGITMVRAG